MFLNSFSSFFNEVICLSKEDKYKILSMKIDSQEQCIVECDLILEKKEISFKLEDIINSRKLKYFSNNDIIKLSDAYKNKNVSTNFEIPQFKYLIILTQVFIVLFLASNIAATKLIQFMGVTFSAGMLTFPMLYVLNDVVTEVYGFKASRRVILQALFLNFLLFTLLYIVVFLPSYGVTGFDNVFSFAPRIFLASMLSYLIGEFLNSYMLSNLKIKFKGSYFGLRALFSTLCGAIIDTSIFFFIVVANMVSSKEILPSIIILALVKVFYEVLFLPITVHLVAFLKREEGSDVFEKPNISNLNPFN